MNYPENDEALTRAILNATSGSVCRSAHDRLCSWVDDELNPSDTELLLLHLETCAGCRDLASALRTVKEALTAFVDVSGDGPDPFFVRDVMLQTIHAKNPWRRRGAAIRDIATGLLQRPRAALELAYGGAMLALLIFGPVLSPPKGIGPARHGSSENPAQAAALRSIPLADAVADLGLTGPLHYIQSRASETFQGTLRGMERDTAGSPSILKPVRRSARLLLETLQTVFRGADQMRQAAWNRDFLGTTRVFQETKDAIRLLWGKPAAVRIDDDGTEPRMNPSRPDEREADSGRNDRVR